MVKQHVQLLNFYKRARLRGSNFLSVVREHVCVLSLAKWLFNTLNAQFLQPWLILWHLHIRTFRALPGARLTIYFSSLVYECLEVIFTFLVGELQLML